MLGAKKSVRLRRGEEELDLVSDCKQILRNTRDTEVIEQSRWGNMVGWVELYWRKLISSLSLSDIRIPLFPLWFFLMHEIPFPSDLLLLFFNHAYIFQVRKEPVEPLDPKVCWSIKYLFWISSLDSFGYGYCPWVLTLSFFGFFFCVLVRKQTLLSLMGTFYNEMISQNPSLFCTQVIRVRRVLVEWQVSGLFSWSNSLSNIHVHYLSFQIAV